MSENRLLQFAGVGLESQSTGGQRICLRGISFEVNRGEAAMVKFPARYQDPGIARAALGLGSWTGRIRYRNSDWAEAYDAGQMRSSIARIYGRGGWISDLTIYENIALQRRFHQSKSERKLRSEVDHHARRLGIEMKSLDYRPGPLAEESEYLVRCQFLRALVAESAMIVLEEPLNDFSHPPELIRVIESTREEQDVGVLWITTDNEEVWDSGILKKLTRYKTERDRFERVDSDA